MRLSSLLHIIISASLLAGYSNVQASVGSHKAGKSKKLKHSVAHKQKTHHGSLDIWERVRAGMQIPRPGPVAANLFPEASHQPVIDKSRIISSQNSIQCTPSRLVNNRYKKVALSKKTNTGQVENRHSRVHVQLNVRPKANELSIAQELENLSPEDAIEAIEAIESAAIKPTAKTMSVESAAPCSKQPTQHLASTQVTEQPTEAVLQQALNYERVQNYITRYSQNPGFLAQVTERARPYLYHIVESLSKSKMPMELALLPIVESAYQPRAESPKQAAGLWQFIPSTGQDFNLNQRNGYDDRLDVIASTEAAIRYLSFLKQHFHGDWLLALAAYNCGLGTVDEAISRNLANGDAADYWSLQLPEETQAYVPRLLALSSILANPSRHSLKLAKINNEPYFAKVNVAHEIDIKYLIDKDFNAIAGLADMSHDQFSLLNPGYLSDALMPKQPFTFLIPVANVKQLNQRLHTLAKIVTANQKASLPFSYVTTLLSESALAQFGSPFLSLALNESVSLSSVLKDDPFQVTIEDSILYQSMRYQTIGFAQPVNKSSAKFNLASLDNKLAMGSKASINDTSRIH